MIISLKGGCLMKRIDGVSRKIQQNTSSPINYGYIAIPNGVDREAFIETCFRRNRVTIITDYGAVINECYIFKNTLQQISFPNEINAKGSCICYVCGDFSNKPVVIGVIEENDQSSLLNEGMFRLEKTMGGTTITIQGDPANNSLSVNVTSVDPSKINIFVKGNEENAVNIESSGAVNVTTDKMISLKSFEAMSSVIFDVENQEDIHNIIWNKDNIIITRKNQDSENIITINNKETSLIRNTQNATETVKIDDEGILASTKDDMRALLTKDKLDIQTGQSTLVMDTNLINFNGGGLEGLVEINELTSKLNDLVSTFNSHQHNVPVGSFLVSATAGVPNPVPVPVQATLQTAQNFNKGDYENTKIKQG